MSQPLEQFQKLLGTSGNGASSPLVERGIDRYEMSSIPAQSSQKNWRYALVKGGDDSRIIHLDGGNGRTFAFRFDGAPTADQFSSGEPVPLTRLGDSTKHNKGPEGEVVSKGVIQVHKSTPTTIHATLQDGKSNSTVMFEQADGNWTMRGTPKKKRLSEVTARFVSEVSKQAAVCCPCCGTTPGKYKIQGDAISCGECGKTSDMERWEKLAADAWLAPATTSNKTQRPDRRSPSIAGVRGHGPGAFPTLPGPQQMVGASRPRGMRTPAPAVAIPKAIAPQPGFISTIPLKGMVPSPLEQIGKVAGTLHIVAMGGDSRGANRAGDGHGWLSQKVAAAAAAAAADADAAPRTLVTYVPSTAIESVKQNGLLSGNELAKPENRPLLELARNADNEDSADDWLDRRDQRLKETAWTKSYMGPSVFFGEPDPNRIHDKHPLRRFGAAKVKIDLDGLLQDHPDLKLHGTELVPFAKNYDSLSKIDRYQHVEARHHDLAPKELDKLLRRGQNSRLMWRHYRDPEGERYAGNVPHAQLLLDRVDPKYLDFSEAGIEKAAANDDGNKVYAVDLDGTLAERYKGDFDPKVIGAPIKSMRRLVRLWTRRGKEVRIFTARAADPKNIPPIKAWLKEHGMEGLEVTNEKTPDIDRFIDDKAIAVIPDTGRSCHRKLSALYAKFATGKFRRPENFDHTESLTLPGKGYRVHVGCNDWEFGYSWAAVYHNDDEWEDQHYRGEPRVWIEINHKNCPACQGGECPYNDSDDCAAFGRKVVKRWINNGKQNYGRSGRGDLEEHLLEAAREDPDVKSCGQSAGQKEAADISVDQARQGMSAPVYPKDIKFLGTLEKRRWQRFGDANEKTPEGIKELQSIGGLSRGAPEVNLLPGGPLRGGFHPPSEKFVQPGWFKQPFYGKSFGSELARANQYRANNPEVFRYEKVPDWNTPVEVNHFSNIGELGGGGAVRSSGKNNEVDLGNPDPGLLRGIGGPVNLLKHEAYHAALEPRDTSLAAPVRNMLQFFDPTSGDRGANLEKRMCTFRRESLNGNPLAHHDVVPAEMRNYMSSLQEHQFKTTGSRFTSPEQYQDFLKTVPFGEPSKMEPFLKALPYDPARMFRQLDKVRTSTPETSQKIMDWQAKTIPGYVDATKATIPKVAGLGSYLKILRDKFTAARKDINLTPTKPQIEAQNYRKGHVWANGFDITIETPKGSGRSGTRPDGTAWKSTMAADYGDIRNYPRSKADGDNMDVFVGPHPSSEIAYVIDQNVGGKFDEHKIILGAFTSSEAKAIYQDSYDDQWKGFSGITALTIRQLKSWLRDGDTSKPLAGQDLAKHVKTAMAELDHEEKIAADNSYLPPFLADAFNNPLVSNAGVAMGTGAARGALVAALIHGARTLKRENLDEPKRDLNLTRDLLLGTAIGAGSGALLHYTPEVMEFGHNVLTPSKLAHVMDIPLAPLHIGGGAAPLVGAGYGAIVGAIKGVGGKIKRKITGEPEDEQFIDDVLNSAQSGLNIGSMAALSGMNPASMPALHAMNADSTKRRRAPSPSPVAKPKAPPTFRYR